MLVAPNKPPPEVLVVPKFEPNKEGAAVVVVVPKRLGVVEVPNKLGA